jgi:hypothetical protein
MPAYYPQRNYLFYVGQEVRRSSYAKPFLTYLDNSTPPAMKSMIDTFKDKV